jgi:hypothetical protein
VYIYENSDQTRSIYSTLVLATSGGQSLLFWSSQDEVDYIASGFIILIAILLMDQCPCERIHGHLRITSYYVSGKTTFGSLRLTTSNDVCSQNPLANLPNVPINKIGMLESKLIYILAKFLNLT